MKSSDSSSILWLGLACAMALVALISLSLFVAESGPRTDGTRPEDFIQYYVSSYRILHQLPVYVPTREASDALAPTLGFAFDYPNIHPDPPFAMLVLAPLSWLPYRLSWWLLAGFSLLFIPAASAWASRIAGLPTRGAALLALATLAAPALFACITLNHHISLTLVLMVGGWVAMRAGHLKGGAALWGVAAALKLFPGLCLLPLLHKRFGHSGAVGLAVGGGLTGLAALILGPDEVYTYLTEVVAQSSIWREAMGNHSLVVAEELLHLGAAGPVVHGAVAILAVAWLWRTKTVDQVLVMGLAASLALSPLAWGYYFVLMMPCVAILGARMDLTSSKDRLVLIGLATALLFWPTLLGGWGFEAFSLIPEGVWTAAALVPLGALVACMGVAFHRLAPPTSPCDTTRVHALTSAYPDERHP